NRKQRELFLARDRLGIKPLYYAKNGKYLFFGSELKALLAHPDCPREFTWRGYSNMFYPMPDQPVPTHVGGVHHLSGGEYVLWKPGQDWLPKSYWNLRTFFPDAKQKPESKATYVDRFAELIEDSARLRTAAEVPIGAFLSGGL